MKKVEEQVKENVESFRASPVNWLKKKGNVCSVDKIFGDKGRSDREGLRATDVWLKLYELDPDKANDINNDTLYVMLVGGILKIAIKPPGEKDEKARKCHPIVIVAALVTEDHLKGATNPMEVAIKVRAAIRIVWEKRSEISFKPDVLYSDIYEEDIRKVPRNFAEALLKECVSLKETEALIDVKDVSVLYALAEGRFRRVTQGYAFKKLTQEVFWASAPSDDYWTFFLRSCPLRFLLILYGNILYFVEIITLGYAVIFNGNRELRQQFFSPISCHVANITNLLIMVVLIGLVLLQKGTSNALESTLELARQYREGNISIEDDPRLKNGTAPGITLVELEKNHVSLAGFILLFCCISRFIKVIQTFRKRIRYWHCFSAVPKQFGARKLFSIAQTQFKRWFTKIKYHYLAVFLLANALGSDFSSSFFTSTVYGNITVTRSGEERDGKLEYSPLNLDLEAVKAMNKRIILWYSCAFFLYAMSFFYDALRYFAIIGPLLKLIQRMIKGFIKDYIKVFAMILFTSVGIFVPVIAITQADRISVNNTKANPEGEISSEEDDDDTVLVKTFEEVKSTDIGTLSYRMIVRLVSHQTEFTDIITTLSILALILLGVQRLVTVATEKYDSKKKKKNMERWEFSKYKLLLDCLYIEGKVSDDTCNDGMPFIFPITFIYFLHCLLEQYFPQSCNKKAGEGRGRYKEIDNETLAMRQTIIKRYSQCGDKSCQTCGSNEENIVTSHTTVDCGVGTR